MITVLTKKEIPAVVAIHIQELKAGIFSKIGRGFMTEFYNSCLGIKGVVTLVKKSDNKVIGFVTIAQDTKGLYLRIFKSRPVGIIVSLMSNLFVHPSLVYNVIQTVNYGGFREGGAEILSIAVDEKFQKKGVGRELFAAAIGEFKKEGIKSFLVSTYDDEEHANDFYKKMGCIFFKSFDFRGKKMNYYQYSL